MKWAAGGHGENDRVYFSENPKPFGETSEINIHLPKALLTFGFNPRCEGSTQEKATEKLSWGTCK